jgi:hypothetical protein
MESKRWRHVKGLASVCTALAVWTACIQSHRSAVVLSIPDTKDFAGLLKDALASQRAEDHKSHLHQARARKSVHVRHDSMAGLFKDAVQSQKSEMQRHRAQMAATPTLDSHGRPHMNNAKLLEEALKDQQDEYSKKRKERLDSSRRPHMNNAKLLEEALKDQQTEYSKKRKERQTLLLAARAAAGSNNTKKTETENANKLFQLALKDQQKDDKRNKEFTALTHKVVELAEKNGKHNHKDKALLSKDEEKKLVLFLAKDGKRKETATTKAVKELRESGFLSDDLNKNSKARIFAAAREKAEKAARETVEASRRSWAKHLKQEKKETGSKRDSWSDNLDGSSSRKGSHSGDRQRAHRVPPRGNGGGHTPSKMQEMITAAQKALEKSLDSIKARYGGKAHFS